jgi:putative hydrolase of the HAD superfamily
MQSFELFRFPSLHNLKALLVDFDGTLVNSHDSLKKAYTEFLHHFSCEGSQEEFDALNGPSLPEVVAFLKQKYQLEGPTDELQGLYEEGLIKSYRRAIQPMPNAIDALMFAKNSCGLKVALVTSAEEKIIEASLQGLRLPFEFDAVSCIRRGMRSKPSPDLYQDALQKLGLSGKEALAVEDALNGMLAATAAGVFTIKLMHDGAKQSREIGGMAVEVHGGWSSLLTILKGI